MRNTIGRRGMAGGAGRSLGGLLAGLALLVLGVAPGAWADAHDEDEFKEAEFFIEFNFTDGDAGVQVFLDADEWRRASIINPDGRTIFSVRGRQALRWLGLTELFFESVEPELGDLPLVDFLDLFPEGEYVFEAKTLDGEKLEGEAEFTHVIPCGPEVEVVGSALGDGLDPEKAIVIAWVPVTAVVDPEATDELGEPVCVEREEELVIETYQVIVEGPDGDLVVDLSGDATSFQVPPEMLEANAEYGFEVLAKEESGNQTITEDAFCTGPGACPEDEE